MSVSQWADLNRVLDPMTSNESGPWSTDRIPYAREWMDSASCPWVRRITIVASTQVGKTETVNNIIGYYIHQRPSPIMMVMPRKDDARLVAERRIMPMIAASRVLQGELTSRAHDVKNREVQFRRCVLYMRAAQSPADLASVAVRVVAGDETDKWPRWTGREASPLALVMERTRTFGDSLVVLTSTPTTREGIILAEAALGDMRRFHVPCPHCGTFQVLTFQHVKWNPDHATPRLMRRHRDAWYECEACQERIVDTQKRDMVMRGVWVPDGRTMEEWKAETDRTDHRSYHIWAAYSPWVQWWKIAAEFLASKNDPARMMNFTNSWLAEAWEERVESTKPEDVAACIDPLHRMGQVPEDVKIIVCSVDVQKERLEYLLLGFGLDEEAWVLDAGIIGKHPGLGEWLALRDLLIKPYGKDNLIVRTCLIDSRYRRDEVIDFARQAPNLIKMIAGVKREAPQPFGTIRIDKHPRTGHPLPQSMQVWTINVSMFKDIAAARIARAAEAPKELPGKLHLPMDVPDEWAQQLSSEHKIRVRSGAHERDQWVLKAGHHRNEAWDLLVYALAAGRMIGVERMRTAMVKQDAPTQPRPMRRRPPPYTGVFRGLGL